jgi:hypothetical protein
MNHRQRVLEIYVMLLVAAIFFVVALFVVKNGF